MFRFLLLFMVFSWASCQKNSTPSPTAPGKFTLNELENEKGSPEAILPSSLNPEALQYQYAQETYQVEGEKVVAKFRDPSTQEESIHYWREMWKADRLQESVFFEDPHRPSNTLIELKNLSQNLSLYFSPETGRVKKIIQAYDQ